MTTTEIDRHSTVAQLLRGRAHDAPDALGVALAGEGGWIEWSWAQ